MMTILFYCLNSGGEPVLTLVHCDDEIYKRRAGNGSTTYWVVRDRVTGTYVPVTNRTLERALEELFRSLPFEPAKAHHFLIDL